MRRTALTWLGLLLTLPMSAVASESWKPVAEVAVVTVRVHWVSPGELTAAAISVGKRAQSSPFGFSVLRQNVSSESYTCDIYLLDRPARTWDKTTTTLGHEMAHCLGFSHQ